MRAKICRVADSGCQIVPGCELLWEVRAMKSLESICYALKQERLDQGLTQKQLAEKAAVSRAWLIGLESGNARRAEIGKVTDVVAALGMEFNLVRGKALTADEKLIMERLLNG